MLDQKPMANGWFFAMAGHGLDRQPPPRGLAGLAVRALEKGFEADDADESCLRDRRLMLAFGFPEGTPSHIHWPTISPDCTAESDATTTSKPQARSDDELLGPEPDEIPQESDDKLPGPGPDVEAQSFGSSAGLLVAQLAAPTSSLGPAAAAAAAAADFREMARLHLDSKLAMLPAIDTPNLKPLKATVKVRSCQTLHGPAMDSEASPVKILSKKRACGGRAVETSMRVRSSAPYRQLFEKYSFWLREWEASFPGESAPAAGRLSPESEALARECFNKRVRRC